MTAPDDVLAFWLDEVGPKGWYAADPELDRRITERFHDTWQSAMDGHHGFWLTYPSGALAYIILLDQFSRNMFRGSGAAFGADRMALAAAKQAIDRGWDLKIDEPARQFFYMPLMHSENLCDQDRCVRLITERMPEHGASNLLHAQAHRAIIRTFGRFPNRNAALGRRSSAAEASFLGEGGYGAEVRRLRTAAA